MGLHEKLIAEARAEREAGMVSGGIQPRGMIPPGSPPAPSGPPTGAPGSRGGSVESREEAEALMEEHRPDELAWIRESILSAAALRGEVHGDDVADLKVTNRNIIGAAMGGLVRQGLLASTGEHRRSESKASHGRRSYVYRLTAKGKQEVVAAAGRGR